MRPEESGGAWRLVCFSFVVIPRFVTASVTIPDQVKPTESRHTAVMALFQKASNTDASKIEERIERKRSYSILGMHVRVQEQRRG